MPTSGASKPKLEISIPVYNEEGELSTNIGKLHTFCQNNLTAYQWHITIADNASSDRTPTIGKQLAQSLPHVSYVRLEEKGRGRAVKLVWKKQEADVSLYMDIDLSTDLSYLQPVVSACLNGYDIAIGSRLLSGSSVLGRTLKREIISRAYNILLKLLFQTKFSDAQCGFKSINKKVLHNLLPYIADNEWFMDSELLIVGEKMGYRIWEEAVVWRDNPGSTVRVLPTAMGDVKGLLRLFIRRPWNRIDKTL